MKMHNIFAQKQTFASDESTCKRTDENEDNITIYSLQFTVYSLQFTVYSLQFTVYSLQLTAYSLQLTVYSLQFTT